VQQTVALVLYSASSVKKRCAWFRIKTLLTAIMNGPFVITRLVSIAVHWFRGADMSVDVKRIYVRPANPFAQFSDRFPLSRLKLTSDGCVSGVVNGTESDGMPLATTTNE